MWGGAAALLGALFLGLAVMFASRSLPSYSALKATQPGQTIVVRARDGSEIVELGPSYGKWLDSSEIPMTERTSTRIGRGSQIHDQVIERPEPIVKIRTRINCSRK